MAKSRKRLSRNPNPHNIVFDNPEQERRYQIHWKRKLTPTRYMCEKTLTDLGLKIEVDRMFHVLGMLVFKSLEAPTYERITLEFLSTLEFQLKKRWVNTTRYYFGTLRFCLFNNYHELSVKELVSILRLPLNRPGGVPDGFSPKDFWIAITRRMDYSIKGAKASGIQNLCFRYAQKGLAYTLFGRGDNTGVTTQRDLFFMYSMAQNKTINVAVFAADYLGRVGRANSDGISMGGMITQIALHFGYQAVLLEDTPIAGNTKIDMSALIAQGMIAVAPTHYSVLIHKRFINALPYPDRVAITDCANWLYVSADLDADEGHDTDHFYAGDQFVDDREEGREEEYRQAPTEQFVP